MSTGGNVPAQGVSIQEATTAKKRGTRSMGKPTGFTFGKGTPSKRLKSDWKSRGKSGSLATSLRDHVKKLAGYKSTDPDEVLLATDAKGWLAVKAGGTPEQKSERKRIRKERASNNRLAKISRKKPKQQQKKAA